MTSLGRLGFRVLYLVRASIHRGSMTGEMGRAPTEVPTVLFNESTLRSGPYPFSPLVVLRAKSSLLKKSDGLSANPSDFVRHWQNCAGALPGWRSRGRTAVHRFISNPHCQLSGREGRGRRQEEVGRWESVGGATARMTLGYLF